MSQKILTVSYLLYVNFICYLSSIILFFFNLYLFTLLQIFFFIWRWSVVRVQEKMSFFIATVTNPQNSIIFLAVPYSPTLLSVYLYISERWNNYKKFINNLKSKTYEQRKDVHKFIKTTSCNIHDSLQFAHC